MKLKSSNSCGMDILARRKYVQNDPILVGWGLQALSQLV